MLTLRPATLDDAHLLWECRNDPDARRASLIPEPIPFTGHVEWFRQSLTNPLRRIWIAETSDHTPVGYGRLDWEIEGGDPTISVATPVGYGRLDWEAEGGDATISVAVVPVLRHLGFGVQIIQLTTGMSTGSVWASIKSTNVASLRAFAAARYQPIVTGDIQQWKFSR